jgi:polyhydroxyalkanoate synthesis regulator phasin
MQDAWRAYLELALGLTEASRKKARKVAKELFGKGGATAAQLQNAAAELVSTSQANRETLARLVRYEVERALGALGLATSEEVGDLTGRVQELERKLRDGTAATGDAAAAPATPAKVAPKTTTKKTVAKKTVAKKTVTKKAVARKAVAKKSPARKAPARKATTTTREGTAG